MLCCIRNRCRLSEIVVPPRIVREMSWVCNYWPENMPYPYTSRSQSTLSALDRPEIQRYCLMSVKDSFTDFHIDFGGTSVWYNVLRVSVLVNYTPYLWLMWQQFCFFISKIIYRMMHRVEHPPIGRQKLLCRWPRSGEGSNCLCLCFIS